MAEETERSSGPKFWPTSKTQEQEKIEPERVIPKIIMHDEDLPAVLPNHLRGNKSSR